jgi:hypothetical protein
MNKRKEVQGKEKERKPSPTKKNEVRDIRKKKLLLIM